MSKVHFVDTSILAELLNIPGKNSRYSETKRELEQLIKNGDIFVLPIAVLVETGNHISKIADGNARYVTANKFKELIEVSVSGGSVWAVYPEISKDMLKDIASDFTAGSTSKKSFADSCIEKQYEDYWKNKQPIGSMRIWTYDSHLAGIPEKEGGLSRRKDEQRRTQYISTYDLDVQIPYSVCSEISQKNNIPELLMRNFPSQNSSLYIQNF